MTNKQVHQKKFRRLLVWAIVSVILVVVAGALALIFDDVLIDIWWFGSLGYEFYFWQRLLYPYIIFLLVSILFFGIFFLNFWIASRFLKGVAPTADKGPAKHYKHIYKAFQTGSLLFFAPLSLAISIPLAMPLYRHWESFLFFIFGGSTGVSDTVFGRDVSFYLFSYPIYRLLERRLLFAFVILLVGMFLLYMAKNRLRTRHVFHFGRGAKWHLSILVLIVFSIEIWDFMLQRYALVYNTANVPLFFGPGYVQMRVILPFIWGALVLLGATAVMFIVLIQFRKGYKTFVTCVVFLAMVLAARYSTYLPQLVENYIVKPNEIIKQKPYITKNIQATLNAYDLKHVIIRDFRHQRFPLKYTARQASPVLRNIPVWDAETLDTVFRQLQELRTYYSFPEVNVDRYDVAGNYQQVFLSAREMDYAKLPSMSKTWVNKHLTYTHGIGVVMTPASQVGGDPLTWFIHSIPPQSDYGLDTRQPRIYYGLGKYPWIVAPNQAGEMDYPRGQNNVMADYQGEEGMSISSLFRKFMFAFYFNDSNFFFSTKFNADSKVLMRRNIIDRIHYLVPFLKLDKTPYPVVTPKGIFWIVDAYTTSRWYPDSAPQTYDHMKLNYIRNSVKIIVNAYTGDVKFYLFDPTDPIVEAYNRIYPGLFQSKSQIPAALRPHFRYPKDYFEIQMKIYAKYHQTDPQVFYQQEDLWTFAKTIEGDTKVPLKPYYLTLDLIRPNHLDFLLLLPMLPKDRDNLRALAIGGCDGPDYGKIIIYSFPKGELVYGPSQIDALIHQDPAIAQQFTLWDQAGSSVVRGKMIILPIEHSVLFIQPVYLKSTSRVNIPELQRIIMSEGQIAVMGTSLEDDYSMLRHRVAEELKGVGLRFPPIKPEKAVPPKPVGKQPPAKP